MQVHLQNLNQPLLVTHEETGNQRAFAAVQVGEYVDVQGALDYQEDHEAARGNKRKCAIISGVIVGIIAISLIVKAYRK